MARLRTTLPHRGLTTTRPGAWLQQQIPVRTFAAGSEFITHDLYAWGQRAGITFTRSRPYQKNDSAHVELRNGVLVRPLIGDDRHAPKAAYAQLARVYDLARLHINFFQPVPKPVRKERRGARVHRVDDRAQTPYQRLGATGVLPRPRRQVAYRDLGGDYFTRRDKVQIAQRLARRLQDQGYDVELRVAAA